MLTAIGVVIFLLVGDPVPKLSYHYFTANSVDEVVEQCQEGLNNAAKAIHDKGALILNGGCYDVGQLVKDSSKSNG